MTSSFKGAARRLTDTDLPRIGAIIGVGEDVLHAVMDVEAPKSGFDAQGRPRILFEPHIFYRELGPGPKRDRAVREGLAYRNWKSGAYGSEGGQYDKLARAIEIDCAAALRSCSWGRGQIMGFNHKLVGFDSVDAMVAAFMASEAAQIEDRALRRGEQTGRHATRGRPDDALDAERLAVLCQGLQRRRLREERIPHEAVRAFQLVAKHPRHAVDL